MPELLKTGLAWLSDQLKEHNSRPVVYARGEQTVTIQAVIGKTEYEKRQRDGVQIKVRSRDFIIQRDDLILNGSQIEPRTGDHIFETDGGIVYKYQLLPIDDKNNFSEPDPFRIGYRIHAKYVSQAPVS